MVAVIAVVVRGTNVSTQGAATWRSDGRRSEVGIHRRAIAQGGFVTGKTAVNGYIVPHGKTNSPTITGGGKIESGSDPDLATCFGKRVDSSL